MPYIVMGEQSSGVTDYTDKNFDYAYPDGLDLKPGSVLHDSLRQKIWIRAQESRTELSKRFSSWREVDKTLTTYIPVTDAENIIKKKDPTKPVSIVFPYSYSMLEALLTYLTLAFFQDPIFRYEGVEPNDTVGAMLLEMTIKVHCIKTKVPLALHTILRDSLAYGVGIGIPGWQTFHGRKAFKTSVTTLGEFGESTKNGVEFRDSVIFEGNDLTNIDPYMWLPDPSVSSDNIQKGEFIGWIDRDNYMNLLSAENEDNSGLFNVKYIKDKKDKRSTLAFDNSERGKKQGGNSNTTRGMSSSTNPVDKISMYINIIPKDWNVGTSEYPEKWFFCLAGDDIVIAAEKANHNHGMYPIAVASPEFDGYSIAPMGRMEILYGLQNTLDFLFNSHVSNVRKAINDMLIVDPYLVNINDLKDPEPGKLIRLRRPAWGRGVDKVVQQLQVNDITRANISDSSYITGWMDRISGADQSMQGSLRQGGPERLTKSEFQGTRGSATSRLQRIAMIIGMQFMQDIGTMFASHAQQYMTQEMWVNVSGSMQQSYAAQFGTTRAKVTPVDLAIGYDLLVRDGSIPGGNYSDAWTQLFTTISGSQELMQKFDITKIFTYMAQQLGAKNVEDFKRAMPQINTVTASDQEVAAQAQAGNLVPMGGI